MAPLKIKLGLLGGKRKKGGSVGGTFLYCKHFGQGWGSEPGSGNRSIGVSGARDLGRGLDPVGPLTASGLWVVYFSE